MLSELIFLEANRSHLIMPQPLLLKLWTVVWQKAPLGLKRCQAAKKIKPVALAIVKLRESESRQLVTCISKVSL